MHYKNYILLFFAGLFFACQNVHKAPKPDSLIPEETMVNLLVDLQKLDATISYSTIQYEKRKAEARDLIYQKYQIDSTQLVQNITYYAEDFDKNERLYEQVKKRLEAEKNQLDSLENIKKTNTDSLETIKQKPISKKKLSESKK